MRNYIFIALILIFPIFNRLTDTQCRESEGMYSYHTEQLICLYLKQFNLKRKKTYGILNKE